MSRHDFVGIGLGPFNLGLACLTEPLPDLDGLFLEATDRFDWHPGLLLPNATLQVPFLADLVTMADPTSPHSFLNFLKETGRIYPFYIRENFYALRTEYNQYCQWAADRLSSVRFGQRVTRVDHDGDGYVIKTAAGEVFRGARLVLGVGTVPYLPPIVQELDGPVVHAADYLGAKTRLQATKSITVIGSGQSAAEVYADLLTELDAHGYELNWITRSPRFFPMEYTKLTLEMTSPEYSAYFQALPASSRDALLREQRSLYKGISADTVNAIFDALYTRRVHGATNTTLLTATELTGAGHDQGRFVLDLHHTEQDADFRLTTDALVLATGYRAEVPAFLDPIRDRIRWDTAGRYRVAADYSVDRHGGEIFVQNAEEHTHGLIAPDLGMGAFRNSVLIAGLVGREVYPIEKRIAFQEFGVPDRFRLIESTQ
jgi:lysine N6-hydroxylase